MTANQPISKPASPSDVHEYPFIPPIAGATEPGSASAGYLIVEVSTEGYLRVEGSREAVNQFLTGCAEEGLLVELDYLSWCG